MDSQHVTRAFPAPAKPLVLPRPTRPLLLPVPPEPLTLPVPPAPAFLTRPAGACASCGAPLSVAGSGVLRHQGTGTVSCRPMLDEQDGGWAEPDGWADGPCATYGRDAGTVARELVELAQRYEHQAEDGTLRAGTLRHAADGLRVLAAVVVGGAA
jgi:hypothetical protein